MKKTFLNILAYLTNYLKSVMASITSLANILIL